MCDFISDSTIKTGYRSELKGSCDFISDASKTGEIDLS